MVTVVTVVFNDVHNIEKTILSVLNLEYKPLEYIIVDGASTDGTTDIIRKYSDRIKRWITEPDKGIYDAMNKGIAMATGDWINFMNSGDRFASPGSLTFFEKAPQADVVYGRARIEYPSFSREWKNSPISEMWKGMAFCHQA